MEIGHNTSNEDNYVENQYSRMNENMQYPLVKQLRYFNHQELSFTIASTIFVGICVCEDITHQGHLHHSELKRIQIPNNISKLQNMIIS
jgi:hypothetical protein